LSPDFRVSVTVLRNALTTLSESGFWDTKSGVYWESGLHSNSPIN
jgi:DNA-binding FadR family transcriptional regulator